jgi:hypothetical protein
MANCAGMDEQIPAEQILTERVRPLAWRRSLQMQKLSAAKFIMGAHCYSPSRLTQTARAPRHLDSIESLCHIALSTMYQRCFSAFSAMSLTSCWAGELYQAFA